MILIPLLLLTVNLTYLGVFTGILAGEYPQLIGWAISAYVGAGICGVWALVEIVLRLTGIGKRGASERRGGVAAGKVKPPRPPKLKRVKEKAGKRAGRVNVCRK